MNNVDIKRDYTYISLILLGIALFMGKIWDGVLLEDPVRYASVAKSILSTGDWVTMHETPGLKYFNKPPLYFWLTAFLFKIFGTTVWAARFWSALSGIGVMLIIYDIVKIYRDRNTALFAAIVLACSNDFLRYTAVGRLDGPQAFFISLAIWGMVKSGMQRKVWAQVVPGVACGLGFLVKGPVVLSVIPLIIAVSLLTGKGRNVLGVKFWLGILAGVIIAVPWHVAVNDANPEFWDRYFGHEMVDRINSEWLEEKSRWIFVRVLLEHYLPWTIFAIYGLYKGIKELYTGRYESKSMTDQNRNWHDNGVNCVETQPQRDREFYILIFGWLVLSLVTAFIPPRMYGRYLVPVFMPLAAFSSLGLVKIINAKYIERLRKHLSLTSILIFLIFTFAPFERHKSNDEFKIKEIAGVIKFELSEEQSIPLFLTEVHAPRAMVYFYCDRVPYFLSSLDDLKNNNAPDYIITSHGGMAQLSKEGFVKLIEAEKMVLAKRFSE